MLLSASIAWAVNSTWLYNYGFEKYSISQKTGLAPAELNKATDGLIHYFNSNEEYINLTLEKDGQAFTLFNEREVAHLKDVKSLFWLDYRILLGTLVYALAYASLSLFLEKSGRSLAWGAVMGGGLTLLLMLGIGLAAFSNFDQFFWQFHVLSFANDFWLLDPAKDYLIMLFPGGFWYDATRYIAISTVGLALIIAAIGGSYLFLNRKNLPAKNTQ
jgi:integral membrane protein (TIGR01906 family)